MSLNSTFTDGICPNIQKGLDTIAGANTPEAKNSKDGLLQALVSKENTNGVLQNAIDTKDGKKHYVDVTFIPRSTSSDIASSCGSCTADDEVTPNSILVDIDQCIPTKNFQFDETEMRKLCEGDTEWISRVFQSKIDALRNELDKRLITNISSNFGKFSDGTTAVKSFQMINSATSSANYLGEVSALDEFDKISASGKPIFVGAGNLNSYAMLQKIGCCNSGGTDLSGAGNFSFYKDYNVGSLLSNANDFIAFAPNSVQLLTYNKYKGSYKDDSRLLTRAIINDPTINLGYDFKLWLDICTEKYIGNLSLRYKLFYIPSAAEGGVNNLLHMRATAA